MKIVDTEWDGLNPTRIWCAVFKDISTGEFTEWTHLDDIDVLKNIFKSGTFIGHNLIGFDLLHLKRVYNIDVPLERVIDTLVLSRLLDSSRRAHSIEAYGSLFNHAKPEHEDWSKFTPEMLSRCRKDVEINSMLYYMLLNEQKEKKLPRDLIRREHFVAETFRRMELTGMPFDPAAAMSFRAELVETINAKVPECEPLFPPLYKFVREVTPYIKKDGNVSLHRSAGIDTTAPFSLVEPVPTNLIGNQGVIKHLIRRHNWKFLAKTKKGYPKLDEPELDRLIEVHPQYTPLKDLRQAQSVLSKVDGWLEAYNPATGRIHSKVFPIGTISHRISNSDPALTQVPSRGIYSVKSRSLFRVTDGCMLGVDASGIQMRILAHYLGDPDYAKEVAEGDVHTANLHRLGIDKGELKNGKWSNRDKAKTFLYAFILGCGTSKAADILGVDSGAAARAIDRFTRSTPGLREFLESYGEQSRAGFLRLFDGRWLPIRSGDEDYQEGKEVWHGRWLSSILQGGEQAVMRRALELWYPRRGPNELMFYNHDEFQVWCPDVAEAERLGPIIVQSIIDAGNYFNLKCPMNGEWKVGSNWHETH
jgi:DNA polymerase I